MSDQRDTLRPVLAEWSEREPLELIPLGAGNIHDTYLVRFAPGGEPLVLQRFNTHVFPDADAVHENLARVCRHARQKLAAGGVADLGRRFLTLRPTRHGAPYLRDASGQVYRAFDYIEGALSIPSPQSARDALEAGRAFGSFARLLDDLPGPPLHVTIPNFHATQLRYAAFEEACQRDPLGRARQVRPEIERLAAYASIARESEQLRLPERVVHNDAKLDNVLFDARDRSALCVLDLDTVMPGQLAYDFGDLARTAACTGREDSRDLQQIALRLDYFEALARGYLGELGSSISPVERASLARGPSFIVFELGVRFLTDYLLGDRYFKVQRPEHNLERARAQLHLLALLERAKDSLARALEACE